MQYTVVHSTNPYLLARLATDLQMSGVMAKEYEEWAHPFDEPPMSWCAIKHPETNGIKFEFHNHHCTESGDPIRYELTSRNYISVLTKILEP